MNKVAILTDSTCDLSPEYIKEHDIQVLPLYITFEGEEKTYLDGVDIDTETIYQKVAETGKIPKTGAANVGELIEFFGKYIDEGYDVIYTGIGSGMSSHMQNCILAAQELPQGRIEIVDSKSLSTGIGLLLTKMVKFRDEGKDIHEIADLVRPLVNKVSAKFCIDSTEFLYKGGRCSGLAKFLTDTFNIKPICKVINGKLTVYKVAVGKYRRAVLEQIRELENDLKKNNVDKDIIFVTDSQRMDGEDDFAIKRVKELVPEATVLHTNAGAIVSSHCGPKTIGILYILKNDMKNRQK